MARPRARLSLKGRALQLLAQRDQSRLELRAKLLRHAAAEARARAAEAEANPHGASDTGEAGDEGDRRAEVEALLDWLEANRYLSAERFAESRVHAREARFGNRRIRAELAQHGVALSPEVSQALAESELNGPPRCESAASRSRRATLPSGRRRPAFLPAAAFRPR